MSSAFKGISCDTSITQRNDNVPGIMFGVHLPSLLIFKYFSCTPHTSLNAVKYVAGMRIGMLLELRRGADPYLIIFLNGEKLGASISLPPDRTWHAVASMGTNNSTVQIIPKPQWPSLVDRSSGLSHLYRSTRDKGLLFRTRIAKYTEQLVQFRKSMSSPTRS